MNGTSSVRELFEVWRAVEPRSGREDFYRVLHSVDSETFLPDRTVLRALRPRTPEGLQLLRMWEAWTAMIEGDRRWGWTILNEISRSLFFLPEPHLLVGAAALLHEDVPSAVRAFRRGIRVDPEYSTLAALLDRHAAREEPVLPFLARNHPVNAVLGRWRARRRKASHPTTAKS